MWQGGTPVAVKSLHFAPSTTNNGSSTKDEFKLKLRKFRLEMEMLSYIFLSFLHTSICLLYHRALRHPNVILYLGMIVCSYCRSS